MVVFGIDFDGTICDTSELKRGYILSRQGVTINPWEANRTTLTERMGVLTDSGYDLMLDTVCCRENTLATEPVTGAADALGRLASEGEVYVITARKGEWLSAAVEWMHGRGLDSLVDGYLAPKSCGRGKQAECSAVGLTYLVDDDPGEVEKASKSVRGVLLQPGYPKKIPSNGFDHARSWEEALEHLI